MGVARFSNSFLIINKGGCGAQPQKVVFAYAKTTNI